MNDVVNAAPSAPADAARLESLKQLTMVVYILQAASFIVGITIQIASKIALTFTFNIDFVYGCFYLLAPLGEAMAAILAVFKDWTPEGANDPVEHIWPEDDAIVSYGNGLVNAALLFRVKFTLH